MMTTPTLNHGNATNAVPSGPTNSTSPKSTSPNSPRIDFLKRFDGSGRTPRKVQRDALEWIAEDFHNPGVDAINSPVGAGKSAKSRAVQIAANASVVISSNILMDQYVNQYPKVNFLKGKAHYRCYQGLTCGEWTDVLDQRPCSMCPYAVAKERAKIGSPTFYNPMSLWYFLLQADSQPDTIVVDEAHQLPPMMLQFVSKQFRQSLYKFHDRDISEVRLAEWMRDQLRKLTKLAALYIRDNNFEKVAETSREMEHLKLTLEGFESDPQNYAIFLSEGTFRNRPETFLNVNAIRPPAFIMQRLLGSRKLILMSGSLFESDIEDLAGGRPYRYLDLPSPIPKERRPILYRPTPYKMNHETDPRLVVKSIEAILNEFPNRNTIIHTTYDRSKKFAPHFKRPVLTNVAEDKGSTLERFKRLGGVFLAAGCAEGLDLSDDICRLNIIPHLVRPNLQDPIVAKRRATDSGTRWYALEAIKTAIQQYGRSTRHEKDHSVTVVLDPLFAATVKEHREVIPRYFTEAIIWTGVEP
jgi:Rad3-related DNA helicase